MAKAERLRLTRPVAAEIRQLLLCGSEPEDVANALEVELADVLAIQAKVAHLMFRPKRTAIDNRTYVGEIENAVLMASLKLDAGMTLDVKEWLRYGMEVSEARKRHGLMPKRPTIAG